MGDRAKCLDLDELSTPNAPRTRFVDRENPLMRMRMRMKMKVIDNNNDDDDFEAAALLLFRQRHSLTHSRTHSFSGEFGPVSREREGGIIPRRNEETAG